jgi:hypothetical protein
MADSPFQLAARSRYRYASIVGDGEWGFVSLCHIAKRVRLCFSEQESKRLAAGKCNAVPCCGNHTVEHFKPEPIPRPVFESRIWEQD